MTDIQIGLQNLGNFRDTLARMGKAQLLADIDKFVADAALDVDLGPVIRRNQVLNGVQDGTITDAQISNIVTATQNLSNI